MRTFCPSPEAILYLFALATLLKSFAHCRTTFEKQLQQQTGGKLFPPQSSMRRGVFSPILQASLERRLASNTVNRQKLIQLLSSLPAAEKRREIAPKFMLKLIPFFNNNNDNCNRGATNVRKEEFPYGKPGKRDFDVNVDRELVPTLLQLLINPGFPYAKPGKRDFDANVDRELVPTLLQLLLNPGLTEKEMSPYRNPRGQDRRS